MTELDGFLPEWWSRGNPIDLVASSDINALPKAVETVIKHDTVDAVLVLGIGYIASRVDKLKSSALGRQCGLDQMAAMGAELEIQYVQRFAELIKTYGKPVICASDTVIIGYGPQPNPAIAEMERLGIYAFDDPSNAARALAHLAERYEYLHGISRRPAPN